MLNLNIYMRHLLIYNVNYLLVFSHFHITHRIASNTDKRLHYILYKLRSIL